MTPQAIGALHSMVECAGLGHCRFDPQDMVDTFTAALSRGDDPEVINVYASYALNGLGDIPFAIKLWNESVRLRPREAQYRINLAELLIATGDDAGAASQIEALRRIGRFGQNDVEVSRLEERRRRAALARAGQPVGSAN
jgi:Flp pilus assembly protein TadD